MEFFAFLACALIGLTAAGALFSMLITTFSSQDDSGEAVKMSVVVFFCALIAAAFFLSGVFSGWYRP